MVEKAAQRGIDGIVYGDMQLISKAYDVLKHARGLLMEELEDSELEANTSGLEVGLWPRDVDSTVSLAFVFASQKKQLNSDAGTPPDPPPMIVVKTRSVAFSLPLPPISPMGESNARETRRRCEVGAICRVIRGLFFDKLYFNSITLGVEAEILPKYQLPSASISFISAPQPNTYILAYFFTIIYYKLI